MSIDNVREETLFSRGQRTRASPGRGSIAVRPSSSAQHRGRGRCRRARERSATFDVSDERYARLVVSERSLRTGAVLFGRGRYQLCVAVISPAELVLTGAGARGPSHRGSFLGAIHWLA